MHRVVLDRRAFLIGSCSLAAASLMLNSEIAVADELTDWLTKPFTTSKSVIDDKTYGDLPTERAQRLVRFSQFVSDTWGLGPYLEPASSIEELFEIKCSKIPSYLTEYERIDEAIERVRTALGSETAAFDLLAFGVLAESQPEFSRSGRFRRFLFIEVARFLMATGGFRRFKPADGNPPAKNYAGFMAGPFNNPAYLPYRGTES